MIFFFYDSFCINFLKKNILEYDLNYRILIKISLDNFSVLINDTKLRLYDENIQYSKYKIINLIFYPFHLIAIFIYIFINIKKTKENKNINFIYLEGFIIFLSGLISIKLLGLKNTKLVYFCGDWFEPKNTLLSKVFYKFFLLSDKIILNNQYKAFYFSKLIQKKRSLHNNTELNGEILPILYNITNFDDQKKNDIVFIGNFKTKNIILEFVDKYQNFLRENEIKFHLFGQDTPYKHEFMTKVKIKALNDIVFNHGYFNREEIELNLKSSICGLNLISQNDQYSANSINAKTIDYLSNKVVPITNIENTTTANLLKKYNLGYVIEKNDPKSIYEALINIRDNYEFYKKANLQFIKKIESYNFLNY